MSSLNQLQQPTLLLHYVTLLQNLHKALYLDAQHRKVRQKGADDQPEEVLVVFAADAVVEPLAVVVKSFHAFVARAAVLAAVLDVEFANLAVIIIKMLIVKYATIAAALELNRYYFVFGVHLGRPDPVQEYKV